MAQRVQVTLIDDVDGSEGSETVTFALDGVTYEIDLSEQNAVGFRDAPATWVGHARRIASSRSSGGRRSSSRTSTSTSGGNSGAIREWARANGHTVSERGRISAELQQAYNAAN